MKLILSTSNLLSATRPKIQRPSTQKSNAELTHALRANIAAAQHSHPTWTTRSTDHHSGGFGGGSGGGGLGGGAGATVLHVPSRRAPTTLAEERAAYDVTLKLFFLAGAPASAETRARFAREALALVREELGAPGADLLVVSFPRVSLDDEERDDSGDGDGDGDTEGEEEREWERKREREEEREQRGDRGMEGGRSRSRRSEGGEGESAFESENKSEAAEPLSSMLATWRALEPLVDSGHVSRLGVAEFGAERLGALVSAARVAPAVDQINVRDCCVALGPLSALAKRARVELLMHNDCSDILPKGTLRELLGRARGGVGLLRGDGDDDADAADPDGLRGEVTPLWVVKYTAVVRDRGVIENKGYFAVAELDEARGP